MKCTVTSSISRLDEHGGWSLRKKYEHSSAEATTTLTAPSLTRVATILSTTIAAKPETSFCTINKI